MSAVREPAKFITASVDSKPSGLRHLLRDMQNRKRYFGDYRDKKILKDASPSAFERAVRR